MFFEFHKASDLSLQDAVRPPKPDILLKKDHSPPPRAVIFFAPFPVYMQTSTKAGQTFTICINKTKHFTFLQHIFA